MLFDDNSFHSEIRWVVERSRNNLIDSRFDHRDEIAPFLKSHFHDVNEVKKRNWVDWTLIYISLNFSWIFLTLSIDWHWLVFLFIILIEILIFYCCAFLKFSEIRVHASLFLIFKMLFFIICRRRIAAILSSISIISYDLDLLIMCRITWITSIDLIRDRKNIFLELSVCRSLLQRRFFNLADVLRERW